MVSTLRIIALGVLLAAIVVLREQIGAMTAAGVWALCLVLLVRSHRNRMLSLAPMYLLILAMFHLGVVVPYHFGLVDDPPEWITSPQLGTTLWLFTMATVAFTLGARLHVRTGEEPRQAHPQPELFWTGLAIALVGATLLWIGIYKYRIFDTTYFGTYERAVTEDLRFYLFGRMITPIGLLVAAPGATRRQMYLLGLLFAAVLGPLFFHGVRGPTLLHAASLLTVWAAKDRATARRIGALVALAAIVLVPVIRVTRDIKNASVTDSLGNLDPLSVLIEAGGSMFPVVVTAEQIESGRERLWMGRSYAYGVQKVLLNVSAERSRRDSENVYPNVWATRIANPSLYELGGGIGYSAVAEPYLNFGPAGVVVVFLLLGVFIGACERWLTSDPFGAAVGAATFGFVLWTVRDDSIMVPRAFVLALSAVVAAWVLMRLRAHRHVAELYGAAPEAARLGDAPGAGA